MRAPVQLRAGTKGSTSAHVVRLGTRRVVLIESNQTSRQGALRSQDGDNLVAAAKLALATRVPLVLAMSSSGADITEGLPALHGWARGAHAVAACSGVVPVLAIVDGPAVSGPALLLGLADQVVMTERSYAFVSGPHMVEQFTGTMVSQQELGGWQTHDRLTGCASLVVADMAAAFDAVADLLHFLPDHTDVEPHRIDTLDDPRRATPEAGRLLPDSPMGSYDVRDVVRAIVDDGDILEIRQGWASNLVTAFATLGGRPVGIVANQPQSMAGTLDIPGSQKGARFVSFCDAFNLALITLVDTPGFYPGKDLEWRGMIRHGAQLAFAYARATVPRLCVALRKSYGGAYIVMDSTTMGSDLYLAWPSAEIAVMGAGQAAAILMRRADPTERQAFEADYQDRLLNPYVAASRGTVDIVIEPAETRAMLCDALESFASKRESLVRRRHDNTPL